MRYGLCMGLPDATSSQESKRASFEEVKKAGFDYVELPLAQCMALDDSAFSNLHAILRDADLPCECCNVFLPGHMRLTGEEADLPAAIEYTKRALARAETLGVRRIVFGSGGARNVPSHYPIAEGMRQIEDFLRAIADDFAQHGILLVIEPLNRMESNVINTLAEGIALARSVSHPSIACLVDYYHEGMQGDASASIESARGLLQHVHVARLLGRAMPVTISEDSGYGPFADALKSIHYNEGISLEAGGNPTIEMSKQGLAVIRSLFE